MVQRPEETPAISVIVPVYNVWQFVGQCMQSLTHQTLKVPYEVLAVNDGSTDRSRAVLAEFAKRYPFVRILDQENAGVSAARMAGLSAARGKYVCFVDSDDYVSENYLELLYNACEKGGAEISCCSYYCRVVSSDILYEYPFHRDGAFTSAEAIDLLLHDTYLQSYLWGKMFQRELFLRAHVRFPKMCFEDLAILNQIFAKATHVVLLDRPLYFYNVRKDSTLGKISQKKLNDYLRAIVMVRKSLEEAGTYPRHRKSYRSLVRKTWFSCNCYLIEIHWRQRSGFFAWLQDIIDLAANISQYGKDDFCAREALPTLPDAIGPNSRRLYVPILHHFLPKDRSASNV